LKRIKDRFAATQREGHRWFMPFLVIGDPDLETSLLITDALLEGGSDALEFGFAFSDPPADGPEIQAADRRALKAGITVDRAFTFLAEVRKKTDRPIALLIYYNLILNQGIERFYEKAEAAGVDAVLVADLPVEESDEAVKAAVSHGIAPVFIISELTPDVRIRAIAEKARGYIYLVARVGVTGTGAALSDGLAATVVRIRRCSDLPILAGFGISGPETARTALDAGVDGVISGSAVVARISQNLGDRDAMRTSIRAFATLLKSATHAETA
jgi:tryptophan synthase alpha chain